MGTWNTTIKGNDTTEEVYFHFFDKYNSGSNSIDASNYVKEEFKEYFEDPYSRNNALFGLALAQWETKSLDLIILNEIKIIIKSESDIQLWKELGSTNAILNRRKKVLTNFLSKICKERAKAKRKIKAKTKTTTNKQISFKAPDNNKQFIIIEQTNKDIISIDGLIHWFSGGGSGILNYKGQANQLFVKWLDETTLKIKHDPAIKFEKNINEAYYFGDEIKIIYEEQRKRY